MQSVTTDLHTTTADDLDLDSLLSDSLAIVEDNRRLKESRKAIRSGMLTTSEQSELLADIDRLERTREWLPKADVAMFDQQTCQTCGSIHHIFSGLFQRQVHRNMRTLDRWQKSTEAENMGLPKEVKAMQSKIPFCPGCMAAEGYPMADLHAPVDEAAEYTRQLEQHVEELRELVDELTMEIQEAKAGS